MNQGHRKGLLYEVFRFVQQPLLCVYSHGIP